jgi:hypothetical protein
MRQPSGRPGRGLLSGLRKISLCGLRGAGAWSPDRPRVLGDGPASSAASRPRARARLTAGRLADACGIRSGGRPVDLPLVEVRTGFAIPRRVDGPLVAPGGGGGRRRLGPERSGPPPARGCTDRSRHDRRAGVPGSYGSPSASLPSAPSLGSISLPPSGGVWGIHRLAGRCLQGDRAAGGPTRA